MSKLPAAVHAKLRAAFASGKVPDPGDPGYDDFFDIYGDLWTALDAAWEKPGSSPARRHVAALVDLWSAIPADGLLTGVAANQPGIVPAAIEAAEAMKLPACAKMLARIQQCIPPDVLKLTDPVDRLEWYESKKGAPLADKLAELEEAAQEGDFATELMEGCIRRVLAEPGEFFEKA